MLTIDDIKNGDIDNILNGFLEMMKTIVNVPDNLCNALSKKLSRTNMKLHNDSISQIYINIMHYYVPPYEIIKYMISEGDYLDCLYSLDDNDKFIYFDEQITLSVLNKLKFDVNIYSFEFIEFFLRHILINNKIIDTLSKTQCREVLILIEGIIHSYNGTITKLQFQNFCMNLPDTGYIVSIIMTKHKYKFDENLLSEICKKCDMEALEYIFKNSVIPNEQHFKAILDSPYYHKDVVELFVKYGYKPNYNDLMYSITKHLELPDIDRFKITYDHKLIDACNKMKFHPNYSFIDHRMIQLRDLCRYGHFIKIREYVENNKVIPDEICMINASGSRKPQGRVLEYLISVGGKITIECLHACVKSVPKTSPLRIIVDEIENQLNIQLMEKDNIIKNIQMDLSAKIKQIEEYEKNGLNVTKNIKVNKKISENKINVNKVNMREKLPPPKKYIEYSKKTDDISYLEIKKHIIDDIMNNSWYKGSDKNIIKFPKGVNKILGIGKEELQFSDIDDIIEMFYR